MGLLGAMFGGGTKMDLQLDVAQVPEGGQLAGRATVHGGTKPMRVNAFKVRLIYVSVQTRPGSSLPSIDTRILLDNTVASNFDLPPGAPISVPFRFDIPRGTRPTANGVSYKVQVIAEIPGIKDPSADVELKVVEAGKGGHASLGMGEIYARWPALQGMDEEPLIDALRELHNACYSERAMLIAAEPLVTAILRQGASVKLRRQALETWANLLDGYARPEHIQFLAEMANAQGLDMETLREVIKACTKFADHGAFPLVQRFAQSQEVEVRREVAIQLRFNSADKLRGKKELLTAMANDPDDTVRAAVFGAFSDFRSDRRIMEWTAGQIDRDPSPRVQAACISALSLAHHHGMLDVTLFTYERHLANPNDDVRQEIAENLHNLPKSAMQRVWGLAQRLLADQSEDVRKKMAWSFINMGDFKELAPLVQYAADNDPSEEVQFEALYGMARVVPTAQLVAYYRARLAKQPTETVMWKVLSGMRDHKESPEAVALLQEITHAPFPRVAERAREVLAGN